ncbi:hypothetical protein ASF96_10455 [Microbacterium sp. Leaf179]|nr:hypothetical protein ASF96_10455 [Microbacterium sp. Leaf179]
MNTTAIHGDVQQIFDQLADLPSHSMLLLRSDDAFYQTIRGVYRVGSWAFPTIVQQPDSYVVGTTHPFWTIVGPDGRVTRDVPRGFHEWLATVHSGIAATPNAVVRHGDYLVVSHGVYQIKAVDYTGDEPVYELINFTEEERREQAAGDAFLAAHPEIRLMQPKWADDAEVMGAGGGEVNVMFERDLGNVTISQWGTFENGVFAMSEDEPFPTITVERLEAVGNLDFIRSVALQMLAAAQLVEEETA